MMATGWNRPACLSAPSAWIARSYVFLRRFRVGVVAIAVVDEAVCEVLDEGSMLMGVVKWLVWRVALG